MVNVVECCFGSCLCLCSRHCLAFLSYLKGPISRAGSSGSGVVCRNQGDWAPCGLQCGEETLVRTDRRPYSPHASLSPPSSFCAHSSCYCTSVCDTNAAEATGTGKTGASSTFASSQPVLSSGMAGQRNTKENQSLGKFSSSLCGWGEVRTGVHILERNTDSFPVTSIYLCLLFLFLTCNFNNWCDREIKLA